MPITKERLTKIQQWRETYGPGSNVVLPAEEAEELARIALASLEAEPVAYIRDGFRADGVHFCGGIISAEEHERTKPALSERYNWKHQPLFVAPPEPVSVPTYDEWLEVRGNKPLGWVKDAMRESYDACRSAMLKGGKS